MQQNEPNSVVEHHLRSKWAVINFTTDAHQLPFSCHLQQAGGSIGGILSLDRNQAQVTTHTGTTIIINMTLVPTQMFLSFL